MVDQTRRQRQAKVLRRTRKLHRYTGLALFVFFTVVGITSVLLGWKKNSEWLQPSTARGQAEQLTEWLPLARLQDAAVLALSERTGRTIAVDRIDARPGKGIVKVIFEEGNYEVQLDAATAAVLGIGKRRSDFIEQLHDGSAVDDLIGWKGNPFKLVYSTVLGVAAVVFAASGFWLWYGPRRMRRRR